MRNGLFRAARSLAVALVLMIAGVRAMAQDAAQKAALAASLNAIRGSSDAPKLPAVDKFTFGDRTVATGAEPGPVAVGNGTLHVRGTVNGDAVSWHGDVMVHQGGHVTGNAWAIGGKVLLDGGVVDGDVRAFDGDLGPIERVETALTGAAAVMHEGALALGWLVVLLTVGIGVLVFASPNLTAVGDGVSRGFGRAFLAGLAAQLALLPMLVLLVVALCLTVLGILLVPFAIVAYVLAAVGLVTLGYLAMAQLTGQALVGAGQGDEIDRRSKSLKAMLVGLAVLMAPWFVASAVAWSPVGELVMRTIAVAVTWVAGTAGLGGALISRGGVKRAQTTQSKQAMSSTGWATPTPVAGVVAARRPTPYSTTGTPR